MTIVTHQVEFTLRSSSSYLVTVLFRVSSLGAGAWVYGTLYARLSFQVGRLEGGAPSSQVLPGPASSHAPPSFPTISFCARNFCFVLFYMKVCTYIPGTYDLLIL